MGHRDIMSESTIENYFTKKVKDKLGGTCIKLLANIFSGIPDRLCLLPGGRAVFVELKAPGKTPRKLQTVVHKRLRALGFEVWVIDSNESTNEFISYYERN